MIVDTCWLLIEKIVFLFCFLLRYLLFLQVLFSSALFTFKPLNTLYSKFERLNISRRTSVWHKSRMPGWEIPLDRVLQNVWTFKPLELDESNFWNGYISRNELNVTKIGGATNGGLPETDPPEFKLFNHSRWTHEIFRVGKYEKKFSQMGISKTQVF